MRNAEILSNKSDGIEKFVKITTRFQEVIEQMSLPIKSNPSLILSEFAKADSARQETFLNKISLYTELIELAAVENINILRDKRFLWQSFRKLNVVPSSDLFEKIAPGDYIEVYDPNGIQIFANFEFCALTSYTFEEIAWFPWEELFGRDSKHTEAIMNEFARCFTEAKGPFKPNIEDHLCWEIMSEDKKRATASMKMFAPIFGLDKKPKAMLATSNIQLLI